MSVKCQIRREVKVLKYSGHTEGAVLKLSFLRAVSRMHFLKERFRKLDF